MQAGVGALSLDGRAVPFAADGQFLIAFDRDAGPTAQLLARLPGGASFARDLAVAPRAWQKMVGHRIVMTTQAKRNRPSRSSNIAVALIFITALFFIWDHAPASGS